MFWRGVALRDPTVIRNWDSVWARGALPQPDERFGQPSIMQFRIQSVIPADDVPDLAGIAPSVRGTYLLSVADVNGPTTARTYGPEEIAPHLAAIQDAIAPWRVYWVKTDSTATVFPYSPDLRGHIEHAS